MSYVIKAVLSNPQCPGYGQVTVPFPIPDFPFRRFPEGTAVPRGKRPFDFNSQ